MSLENWKYDFEKRYSGAYGDLAYVSVRQEIINSVSSLLEEKAKEERERVIEALRLEEYPIPVVDGQEVEGYKFAEGVNHARNNLENKIKELREGK